MALVGDGTTSTKSFIMEKVRETVHYKEWRKSLEAAGHELVSEDLKWVMEVGNGFPLFFAIKAAVKVHGEDRVKDNETVIVRPSVSYVCAYSCDRNARADRFLMVKEYRTPVMNDMGFVYELPGGSSFNPNKNPIDVAINELKEETGCVFDATRFVSCGAAQQDPTVIGNRAHLLSIRLTSDEMDQIEKRVGEARGNASEGERTHIYVANMNDLQQDYVGWDTRGMIFTALTRTGNI